jgi:hypothetical protein
MPLMHGKSKKAFGHNVEVEMEHGHPLKQSLAIAYSVKRKAQHKKAHGGECYAKGGHVKSHEKGVHKPHPPSFSKHDEGVSKMGSYHGHPETMKHMAEQKLEELKAMPKPKLKGLAHGGDVHGYQSHTVPHEDHDFADLDHHKEEKASGFVHHEGNVVKHNAKAIHEDDKMLNQHGEDEIGPEGHHHAYGGEIHPHQSEAHEMDMVGQIMKKRQHAYAKGGHVKSHEKGVHLSDINVKKGPSYVGQMVRAKESMRPIYEEHEENLKQLKSMPKPKLKGLAHGGPVHHYSHGGKVANDDHAFEYEFHTPNQFDDLVKDDNLEFHYTGANSGDYLSDAREDHDRHDIVSKIMKSRAKKDKLPPHYGK